MLGRELTEAAVLRGLCELWQALRISPLFADAGQPAQWELLRVRHRDALTTATGTSQVTALSLLVSMYLQSVYAASSEEIEIFLSPVASRSRVREAVRGLAATRQVHSLSMDAQTYYFLEGGLPEFAGLVAPPTESTAAPGTAAAGAVARVETPRRAFTGQTTDRAARPMRPAAPATRPAKPAAFAPRAGAAPRPGAAPPSARTAWTGPRRSAGKPAASRPYRPERDAGKRHSGPPGRSFPPKTNVEPGRTARPPRPGGPPDTRRDKRTSAWTGTKKRERPGPWVRPTEGSAPAPRAGDRGRAPFREGQKPRPPAKFGSRSGPGSGPRTVSGGERPRGTAPGRPSGGPTRSQGFSPRAGGSRPARSGGTRPPRSSGSPPPRSGGSRPWSDKRPPTTGGPQRRSPAPFRPGPSGSGSAGSRPPAARPEKSRFGPPQGVRRSPTGGPAGGSDRRSYDRPRAGGTGKPGSGPAKSQSGSRGPRAPFSPTRPAKSWPRAGSPSGRPGGKPGGRPTRFQGGKPGGKPGGRPSGKPGGKKPGA
jgi:hypothetical protein